MAIVYRFTTELWLYSGEAPWHFLTLPPQLADEISDLHEQDRRGFGSLLDEVTMGDTTWTTSIFPDTASRSYVLPVKKAVRRWRRETGSKSPSG